MGARHNRFGTRVRLVYPRGMSNWRTEKHGAWVQHEANLWSVEANLPSIPIRRQMTVVRAGNELFLHRVVCCNEETMAAIEALGNVAFLIAPKRFHVGETLSSLLPNAKSVLAFTRWRDGNGGYAS